MYVCWQYVAFIWWERSYADPLKASFWHLFKHKHLLYFWLCAGWVAHLNRVSSCSNAARSVSVLLVSKFWSSSKSQQTLTTSWPPQIWFTSKKFKPVFSLLQILGVRAYCLHKWRTTFATASASSAQSGQCPSPPLPWLWNWGRAYVHQWPPRNVKNWPSRNCMLQRFLRFERL